MMPSGHQSQRWQHGFTLLELLIAMAIFAMLAVVGWQVFDGLNRAKERAQYHADQLSELQYAYLQIQQDLNQAVPYQAVDELDLEAADSSSTANANKNKASVVAQPMFTLSSNEISFVRYADPDPRYQISPTLIKVSYIFDNNQLIRRQYAELKEGAQAVSLDSILIKEISAGRWQAYLPEVISRYPNSDGNNSVNGLRNQGGVKPLDNEQDNQLLPKGVALTFSYHDMPLTWKFALNGSPPLNKGSGSNPESPADPNAKPSPNPEPSTDS